MIYITGDCHQNFHRFSTTVFPEQKTMTKDDYVIICGDFGSVWNSPDENKEECRRDFDLRADNQDFLVRGISETG